MTPALLLALVPALQEQHPLLEDHRILLTLTGESSGDQFGWIARRIPDADGDGLDDLCLSAPYKTIDGSGNAGRVYAYSAKTGALLFEASGQAGDTLGFGIESAGDVNGDGAGDVLAGAPAAAEGLGGVFVYSGKDGELLLEAFGEAPGDLFGGAVSGAGDVDGDGHDDILVGATQHDGVGTDSGAVYLLSGSDGEILLKIDGAPGEGFGSTVDGHTDAGGTSVVVGAPNAGEGNRGRVYAYRYAEGELEPTFVIEATTEDVGLARMFLSFVGDVDGDGIQDVYASDWQSNADGKQGSGRISVCSGVSGELVWTKSGETPGGGFGIGSAEAGDVNGDGKDDLIVGAWQNAEGAPSAGKCYLLDGSSGEVLTTYTCKVQGETFGFDATGIGDVDGDGALDFLITGAYSSAKGPRTGRVFIVAGPRLTEPGTVPARAEKE